MQDIDLDIGIDLNTETDIIEPFKIPSDVVDTKSYIPSIAGDALYGQAAVRLLCKREGIIQGFQGDWITCIGGKWVLLEVKHIRPYGTPEGYYLSWSQAKQRKAMMDATGIPVWYMVVDAVTSMVRLVSLQDVLRSQYVVKGGKHCQLVYLNGMHIYDGSNLTTIINGVNS